MSPAGVTFRRTVGGLCHLHSTVVAFVLFLMASAVVFAFQLDKSEGGTLSLAVIWTLSVSQVLPFLAAFLSMGVVSDERRSGRLDMLLSVPLRERDLVFGKFLGVWSVMVVAVAASPIAVMPILLHYSPAAFVGSSPAAFVPGFFALCVEGTLWCAVSVMMSSVFRRGAIAAAASIMLLVLLPRCCWEAIKNWSVRGSLSFGETALDALTVDMASGLIPVVTILAMLLSSALALFVASRVIMRVRFIGLHSRNSRFGSSVAIVLAFALAGLVGTFAFRCNFNMEWPVRSSAVRFSPRMHRLLAESGHRIRITCFLSRTDPKFRQTARLLRAIKRESGAIGGIGTTLDFVDPRWDVGAAVRLVRRGIPEGSVIFEQGRRSAYLSAAEIVSERAVVTTLQRVLAPPQRQVVYWTIGHGEGSFDDYGPWGYSDIARDLFRSGYSNERFDLSGNESLPANCALLIIAGAKDDFSRAEIGRVEAYLKRGGRMLALVGPTVQGGIMSLLPAWGILGSVQPLKDAPTVSGSDVIVSEFGKHAVSSPLTGSRIVLDRPVVLAPSSAAANGTGADGIEFSPLAVFGSSALAAASERGVGAGNDLSLRPTRVIVVGDPSFVMNGPLATRANANRDFFLNAIAYLSGTETPGAVGLASGILTTGLSRDSRLRFAMHSAFTVPLSLWFFLLILQLIRRRRR